MIIFAFFSLKSFFPLVITIFISETEMTIHNAGVPSVVSLLHSENEIFFKPQCDSFLFISVAVHFRI